MVFLKGPEIASFLLHLGFSEVDVLFMHVRCLAVEAFLGRISGTP